MYWTMEDPLGIWPDTLLPPTELAAGKGFFFDSEYWSKVPRIGIFYRFRSPGVGLDLDLSRWSVLPFFSARAKKMVS